MLLTIAEDPNVRLRGIANTVGVTERRAHTIVADLTDIGYTKQRIGRRNRYEVQSHLQATTTPST